jgi:hypothetical protein
MKFSLWEDRVTTKRSIGTTPFQLVYGTEVVFPSQLALPVENFYKINKENQMIWSEGCIS